MGGMLLNYRLYGEGLPVVILHGLFGMLDNWNTHSKLLAETYMVIAVDLRNHGNSPHSEEFSYEVMIEDLCTLYEHLGLGQAAVIGHSMGGKLAMHFALAHPEKVERLMVVDIAPRAYPALHTDIFEALMSVDLSKHTSRSSISEALACIEPSVRNFLLKNLARADSGRFYWKMNLPAIFANYEAINAAVRSDRQYLGKTMFVKGGRSSYLLDEDLTGILKLFPHTELVTVPRAGHWVHAEAPEEFSRLARSFLS